MFRLEGGSRAPGRDGLSNLRKVSLSLNFRTGSDLGRQSTWSKSPILQVRNVKFKGGSSRVI